MTDEQSEDQESDKKSFFIPTVDYYNRTYANSYGLNDKRATVAFKDFESKEKLRRLQNELLWVKDGKVSEAICNQIVGVKRKGKHESYENWARLMLLWIAQAK